MATRLIRGVSFAVAALALCSCKRASSSEPEALPAADNWSAPSPMGSAVEGHGGGDPHAGMNTGGGDPHAGMNMGGGDPHAGMNMGGDPHAGMDMGGGDPHAGMDMADPQMAAIQPPNPDRPIDESKFLKGQITAAAAAAGGVKPGAIMFLSVRPIDPTTGEIIGGPIAVDRIDITELPAPFHLTERHAMSAGTNFTGDVLIQARVDGDGEARTKEPGDVVGELRAKIPSAELALVLDTVLR